MRGGLRALVCCLLPPLVGGDPGDLTREVTAGELTSPTFCLLLPPVPAKICLLPRGTVMGMPASRGRCLVMQPTYWCAFVGAGASLCCCCSAALLGSSGARWCRRCLQQAASGLGVHPIRLRHMSSRLIQRP